MLSDASQDYLKRIYTLQQQEGRATTSAVAESLGVSAASATSMAKKLAAAGLVEHEPYHGMRLTAAGERIALEVLRHHRLLELYLTEALGVPWDRVHTEAERLEHVLSEELEASIDRALGFPDTDPHGDPIPSRDLVIAPDHARCLVELDPGQAAVVRRVPAGDPSLLRYLADLGLVPEARVEMIEKAPFGGPVTLDVSGERLALAAELAGQIRVEVAA
jgi:DtxR family transcriptional regulator, Mn-dependent transcriptional regulator